MDGGPSFLTSSFLSPFVNSFHGSENERGHGFDLIGMYRRLIVGSLSSQL